MGKNITNSCLFEYQKTIGKHKSEKRRTAVLKTLILVMAFLSINNKFVEAQCSGVSPWICVSDPTLSNITTTTVDLSSVTSTVYYNYLIDVGFVWSTSPGPTITTHVGMHPTTVPVSVTSYSTGAVTLTGLTPGTTYYLRSYGTSSNGGEAWTNYGTQISFTTVSGAPIIMTTSAASSISYTTATVGGTAAQMAAVTITQRGIVYSSTNTNPTTADTKVAIGSGAGTYSTGLTGLNYATTYYVRAYGIGSDGITYYGTAQNFTTLIPISVTTTAPTSVGSTSATTGGSATIAGGGVTIVERGVVYSLTATNPTTANSKTTSGTGAGSFVTNLTGLTSSSTYYARAYAIDNNGIVYYGTSQSFTTGFLVSGVVAPYSLSPVWNFGRGAVYSFPTGSFPSCPPGPTISALNTNTATSIEASTGLCFRNGTTALYTNTMEAYNAGSTTQSSWIRDYASDGTCAGSATGGGVTFPDPANNSTNDAFYMILANDLTGGSCAGAGINRYRFTGTGSSVVYNAGKTLMALSATSSEAIAAGGDTLGGYWVVSHDQGATNNLYVWHFSSTGVITGPTTHTPATSMTIQTTSSGSYLKFSPCMDKIAWTGFNGGTGTKSVSVYKFNKTTGAIGPEIGALNPAGEYGLEFSPDGTKIYHSGQGTQVDWFQISNPTITGTVSGASSWSLQMGPDQQIYTSGVGNADITAVGVITNANSNAPSHTPMTLASGSSVFRGLTNISWLSPQTPKITATAASGCNAYNFQYQFENYFNDDVTIKTGSYLWDFGDGNFSTAKTPSHTYATGSNSYTVVLKFKDSCCSQDWKATTTVNTTCVSAPVSLLNFSGHKDSQGNILYWATTAEVNDDYFEIMKSDDGVNFYSVGKVKGTNQFSGVSNYDFTDYSDNDKSVAYYYLAQYDKDGKLTKSNIIVIRSSGYTPTISPNPSTSSFKVSLPYDKDATILVLDVLGRTIEQKTMGENIPYVIVGEDLSKGSYIISVVTNNDRFFYKVIKE